MNRYTLQRERACNDEVGGLVAAQVEGHERVGPVQGHAQRHLPPLPQHVQLRVLPRVLLRYQVIEVDALPRPAQHAPRECQSPQVHMSGSGATHMHAQPCSFINLSSLDGYLHVLCLQVTYEDETVPDVCKISAVERECVTKEHAARKEGCKTEHSQCRGSERGVGRST